MDDPVEFWVLVLRARGDRVPVPARIRRILKHAASLRLECVQVRDAEASETGEKERVIQALAERVYQQSQLLSRKAEKAT